MILSFRPTLLPATPAIHDAFAGEITSLGGHVASVVEDGDALYLRAVLPSVAEVRSGDPVNAGVALRVNDTGIFVHPFTFRQACSNGAIAAHVIDTHRVDRIATRIEIPEQETTVVLTALRSVIQACAAPAVFATVSSEMRSAAEFSVTSITGILRLLAAAPDVVALAGDLIVDFIEAGDSTAYGLMNAVTAAAKHMQSPERRWQLESIGGGIPARALDLSLAHTGDSALGA